MKGLIRQSIAITLLCLVVMGNLPECDRRIPNVTCGVFAVSVVPGGCVDIVHPCDPSGVFSGDDSFRLCDAPGVFVRTIRTRAGTGRQICAGLNAAARDSVPAYLLTISRRPW